MVADFKQGGMMADVSEKIFEKTPTNWLAQAWSTLPDTPFGPAAFLIFTVLSTRLTSYSCRVRWQVPEVGGSAGNVVGCLTLKWAKKWFSSSASEASV